MEPAVNEESGSTGLTERTIADFGDQWQRYRDNEGYYGSPDILADILGPLMPLSDLAGARAAEIGSGTGRIVRMLLQAGAASVLAIEPSGAFEVLERNLADRADRVQFLRARGDRIPAGLDLDLVVSIGVIHHIPEPDPVIEAAYRALRPGGRMVVWLYGREGNAAAVRLIEIMRAVTTRLPHPLLAGLAQGLTVGLDLYTFLLRLVPARLPLRDYVLNVVGRFPRRKRYLVIYDQLKPAYAKYYTQAEARALLERAGFADVKLYHRRSYSWTVMGTRP
jgi:SAM-dependent methyltransferase